jgi:hypothetical protein
MGYMKNFAMDMEEDFFSGAQDIVHEYQYPDSTCQGADSFVTKMMEYRDQVSHLSDHYVMETLLEIYYG